VFLNGAVSTDPSALWRITHAAMPAAWIIGIESLRLLWRVLRKGPAGQRKRIPLSRWVLARQSTWDLWKRMKLWGMDDYGEALAMELARLRAIEALADFYRSRDWRAKAPGSLTWMLDGGHHMDEALAMVAEITAPAEPVVPAAPTARKRSAATGRKRAPATARKRQPAQGTATALSPEAAGMDLSTEALVLKYIGEGKSASEAGRLAGVTDSRGRQIARDLAAPAPATGEQPAITEERS
jgi:hypothetical protein